MTRTEYFKLALKEKLIHKLKWFVSVLNVYYTENEYCVERDGVMYVKVNGNEYPIDDYVKNEPIIDHTAVLTLTRDDIANIDGTIETTIGKAIINYLLIVNPIGPAIPYLNHSGIGAKEIENKVMELLGSDKITVEQYLKFVDNTVYISNLSRYILQPITKKNLLPPPNIEKIKKEYISKYEQQYGKGWENNPIHAGEFIADLEKVDKEYLKDDPSTGVTMVGKALESRRKTLLTFGANPSKLDPNPKFMFNSLSEGYELDQDIMTGVTNGIIDGSLARGKETQVGGVIYKVLTKMGRDMRIVPGDCGTKLYKKVKVTESNSGSLMGLNMVEGNNIIEIEDPKSLIGKTIQLRSPLFCKSGGKDYCEVCVGRTLKEKKEALGIMFTYISEVFLSASLKKMHNTGLKLTEFSVKDNIK